MTFLVFFLRCVAPLVPFGGPGEQRAVTFFVPKKDKTLADFFLVRRDVKHANQAGYGPELAATAWSTSVRRDSKHAKQAGYGPELAATAWPTIRLLVLLRS